MPVARQLIVALDGEPGVPECVREGSRRGERVGGVVGVGLGRDERLHHQVQRRGLAPLRCREPGDRQACARGEHAGELGERGGRVERKLQRIDGERGVEALVGERQRVDPALDERRVPGALAGDRQQRGGDVDPAHVRPARRGALERQARAAADIDQPRSAADPGAVERCIDQAEVLGLGQRCPVLGPLAPEAALGGLPLRAVGEVGHGHRDNSIQKLNLCTVIRAPSAECSG